MVTPRKKFILAGIFGNALEWYDFTAYAFFVPVLAKLFFPAQNPVISILETFGVFALGFLVRPLGAILFGYLGDHWGRRKALILSIIMMTVPTFFVGLLPTYSHIGVLAPLFLTILRLTQGMAVSGELTTASSFLIEHAPSSKRGFVSSLVMCSAFGGIVLSAAMASLVTELVSESDLYSWGWRIPFLFGAIIGLVGIAIRLRSVDPALYEEAKKTMKSSTTVWQHLKTLNYRIVFLAVLLTSVMAVCNYILIGYFNTFLIKTEGLPLRSVMRINFISLALVAILMPFMGKWSDRIGRKPVLGLGMVGFIFLAYPIFLLMTQQNIYTAFAGEILFAIILAPIAGLIPIVLAELFDTYNRNTGLSISYNVSLAIFGGTAPLLAMTLVTSTQNNMAPAWYIMAIALVSLIVLLSLKETYKKPLS